MNTRDFRFVLAVLAVVGCAGLASATPMNASISYSTSGSIPTVAITGTPLVSFQGVDGATLSGPEPFRLGDMIAVPPNGGVTTYVNTPFFIRFDGPESLDRFVVDSGPPGTPYSQWKITHYANGFSVAGSLNGVLDGTDQSRLIATIRDVYPSPLRPTPTDQTVVANGLPFPLTDLSLPTSLNFGFDASGAGMVSMNAQVVPEPGSWALFAVIVTCLASYRRRVPLVAATSALYEKHL